MISHWQNAVTLWRYRWEYDNLGPEVCGGGGGGSGGGGDGVDGRDVMGSGMKRLTVEWPAVSEKLAIVYRSGPGQSGTVIEALYCDGAAAGGGGGTGNRERCSGAPDVSIPPCAQLPFTTYYLHQATMSRKVRLRVQLIMVGRLVWRRAVRPATFTDTSRGQ